MKEINPNIVMFAVVLIILGGLGVLAYQTEKKLAEQREPCSETNLIVQHNGHSYEVLECPRKSSNP